MNRIESGWSELGMEHSLCKLSLFFHLSNLLCWIYENVKALVM